MRTFLFLAMLGMLVLPSCEPAGGSSDAGNYKSREERAGVFEHIAINDDSNARLAARDSVGKSPQPRHLLDAASDTCPVHREKMNVREIPIVFEDPETGGTESENLSATARFPFGAERIVSAGNALLPGAALTARVYQCESCVKARKAANEKDALPVRPPGSEQIPGVILPVSPPGG